MVTYLSTRFVSPVNGSVCETFVLFVTLTMKLHDFGATVDVGAPTAATTVDATAQAGVG